MREYLKALNHVLKTGKRKSNRTGIDTLAVFGYQMRFDLREGFPLLTTKKMFWKGIVHELLWLISGDTNIKYLNDNGVHIWDEWSDEQGDLGPIYSKQWRAWDAYTIDEPSGELIYNPVDQLGNAIHKIRTNPIDRRIIVNSWNVAEINQMKLPPCHLFYQFIVDDGLLHCHMLMRSADIFLGVPFNIASYALLTHMVAHCTALSPGELVISFTDLHLYENHINQAAEQLLREPYPAPKVSIFVPEAACYRNVNTQFVDIDEIRFDHIHLEDYKYHPAIKAEVAV